MSPFSINLEFTLYCQIGGLLSIMAKRQRYEDIIYEKLYGDIPDDQMGRVAYILGEKAENENPNGGTKA